MGSWMVAVTIRPRNAGRRKVAFRSCERTRAWSGEAQHGDSRFAMSALSPDVRVLLRGSRRLCAVLTTLAGTCIWSCSLPHFRSRGRTNSLYSPDSLRRAAQAEAAGREPSGEPRGSVLIHRTACAVPLKSFEKARSSRHEVCIRPDTTVRPAAGDGTGLAGTCAGRHPAACRCGAACSPCAGRGTNAGIPAGILQTRGGRRCAARGGR